MEPELVVAVLPKLIRMLSNVSRFWIKRYLRAVFEAMIWVEDVDAVPLRSVRLPPDGDTTTAPPIPDPETGNGFEPDTAWSAVKISTGFPLKANGYPLTSAAT